MELEIFPIDVDYVVIDGSPVIRIFGLTPVGERKILYDFSFKPYCYVDASEAEIREAAKGLSFIERIETEEKTLLGKRSKISKVFTKLPEDVPKLRQLNLKTYEADIPFFKRYMLDKQIGSSSRLMVKTEGDSIQEILKVESGNPPFRMAVFDIETFSRRSFPDPKVDPIIAISVFSPGLKKCITWLDAESEDIERVADEKALLIRFADVISTNGFNILVGYNSDSFDMPYIYERSRILGIRPLFNGFEIKIRQGRRKISEINGTGHIDVLNFIRNIYAIYNLKTETFSLRSVAAEMLSEQKGEFDWHDMDKIFRDRAQAKELCEYCLQDAYLTFKINAKLFEIILEMNKLIGQTISDVGRMTTGAVVEHLIMKKAVKNGELIPNKPSDYEVNDRMSKINVGAFVFQPKPGLYEDVSVVDFRSLYPSIIISHNICPSTISFSGGKALFLKKGEKQGFIPSVLEEIINLRVDAKNKLKKDPEDTRLRARVSVLKLIANGFYGYLGYYNSRWYCFECAGEITSLGREYVHKVIDTAEKEGFNVVYADTDSAFLQKKRIKEYIGDMISDINSTLPQPMELELQGVYKRALFVSVKSSSRGAKKKYVLFEEPSNIIIKGFQSVRRDWAAVAKNVQMRMFYDIMLKNDIKAAVSDVKEAINEIKQGKMRLEDAVIITRLRKDIGSYQQTGRHVSAAKSSGAEFTSGDTIRYIISKGRPGQSISEKAVMFDIAKNNNIHYDPDYYIEKQVIPSVLPTLSMFGFTKDDLIGKKNNSLSDFMQT